MYKYVCTRSSKEFPSLFQNQTVIPIPLSHDKYLLLTFQLFLTKLFINVAYYESWCIFSNALNIISLHTYFKKLNQN